LDLGLALADFEVADPSGFADVLADFVDAAADAGFVETADGAGFVETADGAALVDFVAFDSATAREIRPRRVRVAVRLRIVFMSCDWVLMS
jgi:hypothetical protein